MLLDDSIQIDFVFKEMIMGRRLKHFHWIHDSHVPRELHPSEYARNTRTHARCTTTWRIHHFFFPSFYIFLCLGLLWLHFTFVWCSNSQLIRWAAPALLLDDGHFFAFPQLLSLLRTIRLLRPLTRKKNIDSAARKFCFSFDFYFGFLLCVLLLLFCSRPKPKMGQIK